MVSFSVLRDEWIFGAAYTAWAIAAVILVEQWPLKIAFAAAGIALVWYTLNDASDEHAPSECPECGHALTHTAVQECATGKENRGWSCPWCGESGSVKHEL